MSRQEVAEVGERVDISILRGEQTRLNLVAISARRIEDLTVEVSAQASERTLREAVLLVEAILSAWAEWGVVGVTSHLMQHPLTWTITSSDENDA